MSDPSRTTPLARKLLRELDAADPETFRRLADHILCAAAEGLCPICSRQLETGVNGPWCPPCIMCWDPECLGVFEVLPGRDFAFREFWMRGWQDAFLGCEAP